MENLKRIGRKLWHYVMSRARFYQNLDFDYFLQIAKRQSAMNLRDYWKFQNIFQIWMDFFKI